MSHWQSQPGSELDTAISTSNDGGLAIGESERGLNDFAHQLIVSTVKLVAIDTSIVFVGKTRFRLRLIGAIARRRIHQTTSHAGFRLKQKLSTSHGLGQFRRHDASCGYGPYTLNSFGFVLLMYPNTVPSGRFITRRDVLCSTGPWSMLSTFILSSC